MPKRSEKRSEHATTRRRKARLQWRPRRRFRGAEVRLLSRVSPERRIAFSNKKAPRDALGRMAWPFLAKSAALCGMGGWPGLRLFSRLQWRDRGRFTRPSPLPLPAKMKDECMPGVGGSQFDWFGVPLGLQSARRRDFAGRAHDEKTTAS